MVIVGVADHDDIDDRNILDATRPFSVTLWTHEREW